MTPDEAAGKAARLATAGEDALARLPASVRQAQPGVTRSPDGPGEAPPAPSERALAVTGGRTYDDVALLHRVLDAYALSWGRFRLFVGDAPGADALALAWANHRCHPSLRFVAAWKAYGNGAGPRRNQKIIDAGPRALIAFPGGRGTEDCVKRAAAANIPVHVVRLTDANLPAIECLPPP